MEVIVGKTAGFCYGVKRAINGAIEQVENNNLFCLGEIVHNKQVIEQLEKRGIKFIDNINQIKTKNTKVIIRAHGIQKEIYEKANNQNIEVLDYTCPNVLRIHEIAKEYEQKGFYIILCGKKEHPENIGTISYCGNNYSIVQNEKDLEEALNKFEKTGIIKLLVISQTTYSIEKFNKIVELIKSEVKDEKELVIKNTICRATELRQKETQELSKEVDFMIIIGGKNSSNTIKLYEIAKNNCKNSVCIETADELKLDNLKEYEKIGIMAGASTPKESIDDVLSKLNDLKDYKILKI